MIGIPAAVWLLLAWLLGGFAFGWSLAVAYRLWSGTPAPTAPPEGETYSSLAELLADGWHRFRTGRFLPWTPRRYVPWSAIDMLVVGVPVAALIFLPMLAPLFADVKKPAARMPLKVEQLQLAVLMDSTIKTGYLLLATVYLMVRARARPGDLGLAWRTFGRNVAIGLVAFPMIAVPVYALQGALVWLGKWTYEHPLIEMLQQKPEFGFFLLLSLAACVVAPLTEEWFFRALFQGWLERAFSWRRGQRESEPVPQVPVELVVATPAGELELNPYAAPAAVQPLDPFIMVGPPVEEAHEETFPRCILAQWTPILLSSLLFGLAHFGHGPAPVTLTVLALALGYLYQRTHSIVPVIVIHALFNSVSMFLFYIQLFQKQLLGP